MKILADAAEYRDVVCELLRIELGKPNPSEGDLAALRDILKDIGDAEGTIDISSFGV